MKRYTWRTFALEAVMIAAAAVVALPIYVLINLSLRSSSEVASPLQPTAAPTLENFQVAWEQGGLAPALGNSLLITTLGTALTVVVSALAAYPLARIARRWSRATFALFIVGLLLPGVLGALPLYQSVRDFGLLGTPWALVIIYGGTGVSFSILLYVGFLRALPPDFEQAALIDGCTPLQAFWYVVLPAMRPVTSTVIVLNAVGTWNDFFTPLLFLSGTSAQTLPVAVTSFVSQYFTDWGVIFAGIIIAIAPVLVFYLFLQRYIINGFAGGLKG